MSARPESARGLTRGICEMKLEARDPERLASYRAVFGWYQLSREDDGAAA